MSVSACVVARFPRWDPVAAALIYARGGWPVFPCWPGSKEPATRHGFQDATTDLARVERFWTLHPDFNLAVVTGSPGPDVLDIDVRPHGSGYAALARLRSAGLLAGGTHVTATPSGGVHLLYPGTWQHCRAFKRELLDFKAQGGYVLVAPSVVDGTPYRLHATGRTGRPLDIGAVARCLRPPAPAASIRPSVPATPAATLARLGWLWRLRDEPSGRDRSGQSFALVAAAIHADLRDDQIVSLALQHRPTIEKYGDRAEREIRRAIDKLRRG